MRPVLDITPAEVQAALTGLVAIDVLELRSGIAWPGLYASGVRYQREPRGVEEWQSIRDLKRTGRGDCEDLASALVAEWWYAGDRGAHVVVVHSGPGVYHVLASRGNGQIEDPSARLGMGKKDRTMRVGELDPEQMNFMAQNVGWKKTAHATIEIGADGMKTCDVTFDLKRTADGWHGIVRVPLEAGRAAWAQAHGKSEKQAKLNALANAGKVILTNPALRAALPGPARFALELATSKKAQGIAKSLWGMF